MQPGSIRSLPNELVVSVFDYLTLPELLRMAHVSTQCRALARAHPTFWRNVRVCSLSEGALALFVSRLESTNSPGLRITVDISLAYASRAEACSIVLRSIGSNLARTKTLKISLLVIIPHGMLAALCQPAPVLETFRLAFHNVDVAVPLPHNLFGGQCPQLLCAILYDCALPEYPIAAFARVQSLLFATLYSRGPLPVDLFRHFPELKNIHLGSKHATDNADRLFAQFQNPPALDSLNLQLLADESYRLLSMCPALFSVPTVVFRRHEPILNLLVSHLPGPLGLELANSAGSKLVRYTVLSHSCGWRRTFMGMEEWWWPSPDFYKTDPVARRLVTLEVTASTAYVTGFIGELRACETLHVVVDRALHATRMGTRPLSIPRLKLIMLRRTASGPSSVGCGAMTRFLANLVSRGTGVLLQVDGLSLGGDTAVLAQNGLVLGGVREHTVR